jgi:hypothetical protein
MINHQKAEAIFKAPKCLQCDIYMYPFIERVFLPPEYEEINYYRNMWFCGYCVFDKSEENPS